MLNVVVAPIGGSTNSFSRTVSLGGCESKMQNGEQEQ